MELNKEWTNIDEETGVVYYELDNFGEGYGIGEDDIHTIFRDIDKNKMSSIIIANNWMRSEGAHFFAKLIVANKIELLDLRNNDIPACAVFTIAAALEKNTSLKYLDLSDHYLRGDDRFAHWDALSVALRSNKTLETLVLARVVDNDDELLHVISALEYNTSLKMLVLISDPAYHLRIGPGVAEAIAKVLRKNTTLKYLDLSNWYCSNEAHDILIQAMRDRRRAKKLQFRTILSGLHDPGSLLYGCPLDAIKTLCHSISIPPLRISVSIECNAPYMEHEFNNKPEPGAKRPRVNE